MHRKPMVDSIYIGQLLLHVIPLKFYLNSGGERTPRSLHSSIKYLMLQRKINFDQVRN